MAVEVGIQWNLHSSEYDHLSPIVPSHLSDVSVSDRSVLIICYLCVCIQHLVV